MFYFSSANNNWETNFALSRSCESSPHAKKREIGETAPVRGDSMAYSCLLKNELLGTAIDDVKSVTEDRNENQSAGPMGNARRGLFKYQSPSKQVRPILCIQIKHDCIFPCSMKLIFRSVECPLEEIVYRLAINAISM